MTSAPDRFELIKNPPLNKRTGLRQWTGELAKKAVGWKTDAPATVQEAHIAWATITLMTRRLTRPLK